MLKLPLQRIVSPRVNVTQGIRLSAGEERLFRGEEAPGGDLDFCVAVFLAFDQDALGTALNPQCGASRLSSGSALRGGSLAFCSEGPGTHDDNLMTGR
jgi:hypothetical protein